MTTLLDANVLIALLVHDHVHHPRVSAWWVARERVFATSPSTQGSLLRFLVREVREGCTADRSPRSTAASRRCTPTS